jgi:hypothetical protein
MKPAPGYMALDDTPSGAILDGHAPLYVANLAVPFLVSGAEKDELQRLGTLCGRGQDSKIISTRLSSQVSALILAETRQ